MKGFKLGIFIFCFVHFSCNDNGYDNKQLIKSEATISENRNNDGAKFNYLIQWVDSAKENLIIDTMLSHTKFGFSVDSALVIEYIGFVGEHTSMPLNDKGQWINSIKTVKKLNRLQLKIIQSVFGDANSYKNPIGAECYEPGMGIIYFKNGSVIGQSAICLSCAKIQSTAQLADNSNLQILIKVITTS